MKGINLKLILGVEVKDAKGKTTFKKSLPSRSLTIAFLQIFEALAIPTSSVTIKDYLGADKMVTDHADDFNMNAIAGAVDKGIIVGTGSTAPDNLDYVMETPIAHGTGAGELSYGSESEVTTAEVGPNVDYIQSRTFNNGSGGAINVTEFGIYAWAYAGGDFIFMIAHDVTAPVNVPNSSTLTVTYTFRTTV